MTEKKNTATEDIEEDVVVKKKELNLDAKVTVKNLAGWTVTFARIQDGIGDIIIVGGGSQRLSRNEIIAQIQIGNTLFNGVDGKGSHATIYIDDAATREEVDFESKDKKQTVITDAVVKTLFGYDQTKFENELPKVVLTRAEKYAVMQIIKKLNIDNYAKIKFVEKYTGYTL